MKHAPDVKRIYLGTKRSRHLVFRGSDVGFTQSCNIVSGPGHRIVGSVRPTECAILPGSFLCYRPLELLRVRSIASAKEQINFPWLEKNSRKHLKATQSAHISRLEQIGFGRQ